MSINRADVNYEKLLSSVLQILPGLGSNETIKQDYRKQSKKNKTTMLKSQIIRQAT